MLPMRTKIFIAIKFWLPRLGELARILPFGKVDSRTLAKYEIEKAKVLRTQLFKELARR
jgi:hypothetical protein